MIIFSQATTTALNRVTQNSIPYQTNTDYKITEQFLRDWSLIPTEVRNMEVEHPYQIPIPRALSDHPSFDSRAFLHICRHSQILWMEDAVRLRLGENFSLRGVSAIAKVYCTSLNCWNKTISRPTVTAMLDLMQELLQKDEHGFILTVRTHECPQFSDIPAKAIPLLMRFNHKKSLQLYTYFSRRAFYTKEVFTAKRFAIATTLDVSPSTVTKLIQRGSRVGLWEHYSTSVNHTKEGCAYNIYTIRLATGMFNNVGTHYLYPSGAHVPIKRK